MIEHNKIPQKDSSIKVEAQELVDKLQEISKTTDIDFYFECLVENYLLNIRWKDDKKDAIVFEVLKDKL